MIPEPNDAVISADAMNVVYRGVDNPVSVSLPGVSSNNLNVSATGGQILKMVQVILSNQEKELS